MSAVAVGVRPNLFVIGAPKSGTTTLYHWLRAHPEIWMAAQKEPSYFCGFDRQDWQGPGGERFRRGLIASLEDYEALFTGGSACRWRGEASTDYLWVEEAPTRIAARYGTVGLRFIVVLRDPVERAFSEHGHLVREGLEDLDFIGSLEMEDERFKNHWHPLFYHRRRGLYHEGLSRYFSIFGRDSIKVVPHPALRDEPARVVADIADFLGVQPLSVPFDVVHNRSGRPRSRLVNSIVRRHSPVTRWLGRALGSKLTGRVRAGIDAINLERLSMSEAERVYAEQLFADDLGATEQLAGMRLRRTNRVHQTRSSARYTSS